MNIIHTPQSKAADQKLNGCLPAAAADKTLHDVIPGLRLARILDYEAESLAKPAALEACVGASNGTMMQIGARLGAVINDAIVGLNVENFARVQPVMDAYLRCMRQVDRYSHLEAMLAETRRKAEEARPTVPRAAQRGILSSVMSSKKSASPSRW